MKKRNRQPPPGPRRTLETDVHEAMRALGWVPPQCEDDVHAAEAELDLAAVRLPAALADPPAGRAGRPGGSERVGPPLRFPADPDIDATLARAAREGGQVPPEIEQIMRRDREAAERQARHGPESP